MTRNGRAPGHGYGRRCRSSQADVGEAHPPVLIDEHVGRLQCAVHQCATMEVLERPRDLGEEPAGRAQVHRPMLEQTLGQRVRPMILGGEPEDAVRAAVSEYAREVRVIEAREGAHRDAEPLLGITIGTAADDDLEDEGASGALLHDPLDRRAIASSDEAPELELVLDLPPREFGHSVHALDHHRGGRCEAAQVALAGEGRDLGDGAAGTDHAGGRVVGGGGRKIREAEVRRWGSGGTPRGVGRVHAIARARSAARARTPDVRPDSTGPR